MQPHKLYTSMDATKKLFDNDMQSHLLIPFFSMSFLCCLQMHVLFVVLVRNIHRVFCILPSCTDFVNFTQNKFQTKNGLPYSSSSVEKMITLVNHMKTKTNLLKQKL